MKEILGMIEEDLLLHEDTKLRGIIVGQVTVPSNITFKLNGTVNGDIKVEDGATFFINGTVNGEVFNYGGNIDVYGTVSGRITEFSGVTNIDPKADVKEGYIQVPKTNE